MPSVCCCQPCAPLLVWWEVRPEWTFQCAYLYICLWLLLFYECTCSCLEYSALPGNRTPFLGPSQRSFYEIWQEPESSKPVSCKRGLYFLQKRPIPQISARLAGTVSVTQSKQLAKSGREPGSCTLTRFARLRIHWACAAEPRQKRVALEMRVVRRLSVP